MGFTLGKTGFLSALPYLAMSLLLGIAGYFADWLQIKEYLTTSQVRKYFNCGAFISQTVFMIIGSYVLQPAATIACFTIAVGLGAFAMCGFAVNHLDIAPQFAGLLMGISNTVASIPGIISPIITGYIVPDGDPADWQIVFYIAASIYLFGAVVYWFWSSGEVQPWAVCKDMDAETEKKYRESVRYSGYRMSI